MGWKRGLASLALAAAIAAPAWAAEPGASFGSYEGRDYLLIWPSQEPTSLLVYLHVDSPEPLAYEASSGMLEALAADSALRNYAVLAPAADRNACGRGDGAEPRACWRLDAIPEELSRLDALIDFVERNQGVTFAAREAVGYERGAELLVAALRNGWLGRYTKIGLLDVAPPGAGLGANLGSGPLVYVHAGEGDAEAAAQAAELLRALLAAGYADKICAQGDTGGRFYDSRRLAGFLDWFARDCRPAGVPAPVTDGVAPAPVAEEPADGQRADRGRPRVRPGSRP